MPRTKDDDDKAAIELTILGIRFFRGTVDGAVAMSMSGGLIVVPSAPVLARMTDDSTHREALLNADMAISDSGLMVLLWRLLKGERLERVSGLEYLQCLLSRLKSEHLGCLPSGFRPNVSGDTLSGVLWIMPTELERDRNLAWLRLNGHKTRPEDCYVAPMYPPDGHLNDVLMLEWVRARRPRHIIICLGGGVQERLGYFLKRSLEQEAKSGEREIRSERLPSIHCVGAAIGFLSGGQVRIPMWADYFYLGWLFRCVSSPAQFVPRYWRAVRLVLLLWRHGKNAPPTVG